MLKKESRSGETQMKVRLEQNGPQIIVALSGKIDYETQDTALQVIEDALRKSEISFSLNPVIIDCKRLEFIGSMGITQFLQQARALQVKTGRVPKYIHLRREFQTVIKSIDPNRELFVEIALDGKASRHRPEFNQ